MHPSETWLRDECDGSVYFPDPDGQFNLEDNRITPYSTLVVEGPTESGLNMRTSFSPASHSTAVNISSSSSSRQSVLPQHKLPGPPMFRSVVAPKKAPMALIKIMKAKMSVAKKGGNQISNAQARYSYVCRTDQCNSQRWTRL